MIYPPEFHENNNNYAEKVVFNHLKRLDPNKYDTFHSRIFSRVSRGERTEYEVDFIIVEKSQNRVNAILIVEVKGGKIIYDDIKYQWIANDKEMDDPKNKYRLI